MDDENSEFDVNSLAESLLGKEEEIKEDDKAAEEANQETAEEAKEEADKPAEGEPTGEQPPADNQEESKPAEEDNKPLTREDIRAALREEQAAREAETSQRTTFAGQVRNDLKEALKLDSTYTTVSLEDGTPITSVSQLTQVINPETAEPYTREEASQLLLEAQQIVNENIIAYEKRVDELTDLNINFKEESDEVDRRYGDILKAFPDVAKDLLEAYQKTFKVSDDGTYVEEVRVSPLEFYGPALRPFRNATDQIAQQQAEAKAAEEKAAREAAIKEEQEDRGDLGGTAGAAQGKPDPLDSAIDKYLSDNT
jgi:chemotaxis protein histidine kinase CheA